MKTIGTVAASALLIASPSAQDDIRLEAPVKVQADGKAIDTGTDIGHAGPLVVDWDGDGKQDLLVSAFGGNIRFFKNVGSSTAPEFAEKEPLEAGGEPIRIHNW